MSVSRSTALVEADVVTFQTNATESGIFHTTIVRLADGQVVRASNRSGLATVVGARVQLLERTGWLSGVRRYSISRILPTPPRPTRSDSLDSFPKPEL